MKRRERKINILIVAFLTIIFLTSVIIIAAGKYGLWQIWFPADSREEILQIITGQSEWRYMDSGEEPAVGNVWTTLEYDAGDWKRGKGPFAVDLSETAGSSTSFYIYEFDVTDAGKYGYMEGHIQYADAVILYLNGSVVFAGNVPDGGYASNLDMGVSNQVDTIKESSFTITDLSALEDGRNVLAVEVHRQDETSMDTYFNLAYLNMAVIEYEEETPDIGGLLLKKSEEADAVEVDWLTDLEDAYQVEYMEGTLDSVNESTFSEYANRVIMGNEEAAGKQAYRKKAQITRLKVNTDYVYRVIKIGGTAGSRFCEFHTAPKQQTQFLYPGVCRYGSSGGAAELRTWKRQLKTAVELSGGVDYLILGAQGTPGTAVIQNEMALRSAEELKEIPSIFSDSYIQREDDVRKRRESRPYLDLLLISLDTADRDYDGIRSYICDEMQEKNRKWTAVILNVSDTEEAEAPDEAYTDICSELDVDFVLVNGSGGYSRRFSCGQGMTDVYHKAPGETLYIYGGEQAVSIKASTSEISVEAYVIETGEKSDEVRLIK